MKLLEKYCQNKFLLFLLIVLLLPLQVYSEDLGSIDLDPDFPSLPRKAKYKLVWAKSAGLCEAISMEVSKTKSIPESYKGVSWVWIKSTPNDASHWQASVNLSKTNFTVKKYSNVGPNALRSQSLLFSIDALQPNLTRQFIPEEFEYSLKELPPYKYKAGRFGALDKVSFANDGKEIISANFFDLLKIKGTILISFRSHNTIDDRISNKEREWLIFVKPIYLVTRDASKLNIEDMCYFVREK
jgi:hypothetical protein